MKKKHMKEKELHWFVITFLIEMKIIVLLILFFLFRLKIKDLQKQLNAEKKKNERMQEKLTELLSGDRAGLLFLHRYYNILSFFLIALDELFYIPRTDGSRQGDTA